MTLVDCSVLAIDPGLYQSAWCLLGRDGSVVGFGIEPNEAMCSGGFCLGKHFRALAVELMSVPGICANRDVFMTQLWAGRIIECAAWASSGTHTLFHVLRSHVRLHFLGMARGNDAQIRSAIIDRYGGKDAAIGRKAKPGPLYGVTKDAWSALAIAITTRENLRWEENQRALEASALQGALLKLPSPSRACRPQGKTAAR